MTPNADLIERTDLLERRTSILAYHAKRSRTSLTQTPKKVLASIIRCALSLADICKNHQSRENFAHMLKDALEHASVPSVNYECDIADHDSFIRIEGVFSVEELRKYLITVPQPVRMQGAKNG